MAGMPSPVHLVIGDDEFLAERARLSIQHGEKKTFKASEITVSELLEATSPSLFADERTIIITDVEKIGAELQKIILNECTQLAPGMTIIVMYHLAKKSAKKKIPEFAKKLSKVAEVHEAYELYTSDLAPWLTREFQSLGVRPTPDVIKAVLDGVGSDLRKLASAASQLVADTDGNVTLEAVRDYYSGIAEVANWDIADAAVAGQVGTAVATCRRALQLGAEPILIAFALSSKVTALARLYDQRGDQFTLAKQTGLNPFVVKNSMRVARGWSGDNISKAVIIVEELAATTVGQGGDPDYEVEAAVRRIAELAG